MLLYFTGFTRFSADVQKDVQSSGRDNRARLSRMRELVDESEHILIDKTADLDDFGRLLGEEWKLKRGTSEKVSTSDLDIIYEKAINAGALGGKLLGAGGGGFMLFYVPEEARTGVMRALEGLMHVPFGFENGGTRVVYYSPETYDCEGSVEK